jgi:hypothetical protein
MANGSVTYEVTGVTPDTQFTGAATPVTGKRVSYSTSSGYNGAVFVPDGVFGDPSAVQAIIVGEVQQVTAVQNITGSLTGS